MGKISKKLMIMAAGTGGHIFPGIAIAQTMRERGWDVSWLGTMHGMEKDIVPKHGIAMDSIDFAGMRGKGIAHTVSGAFKLVASFASCRKYLAMRKPDVVLGMGGYVTVPGGMMARVRGVPLALVNADAALLLSNKTLTPLAQRVLFGFPADFGKAAGKAVVTGNPVRKEILEMPSPGHRFAGRTVSLEQLHEEPLIVMQEGAGVRQVIEDELRRAGIRLRDLEPRLELGLQESVKSAVAVVHGVTFISRAAIEADLAAGTLSSARVKGLDPVREISLVRSVGRSPTRAAEAFLTFAKKRLP